MGSRTAELLYILAALRSILIYMLPLYVDQFGSIVFSCRMDLRETVFERTIFTRNVILFVKMNIQI
jgi:hypothetical protein